jgi:hypothetical protein
MKNIKFEALRFLIILTSLSTFLSAQSGRKEVQTSPTPSSAATPEKKVENSSNRKELERVEFVLTGNFRQYLEEINKFGRLGYRVEKAFNYGGDTTGSQKFAAVLRLDAEDTFEYDWTTSPNKKFLETRLNAKAERGFYFAHILPVTNCDEQEAKTDDNSDITVELLWRFTKSDIFLLEKRNNKSEKNKEYKVLIGKIGLGKSPTTELQNALDKTPAGFHPIKILFNKSGVLDFSVSVLLEKDLLDGNAEKIEYKFIKEVNGFEKEINTHARNGFQLIAGRRIGLVKFALLAKVPGDAVGYVLLDADKYQKELAKKVSPANVYKGMFLGDAECDEPETTGGKLVFAQTADETRKTDYKFLKLTNKNALATDDAQLAELKKLLKEDYYVRDIFYADGAIIILEK